MAQDYHIYIHSDSNGNENKTTPFSAKDNSNLSFPTKVQKAFSETKSMSKNFGMNPSSAALSKVAPYAALAVVIANTVENIIATGFAHQAEYTGNYKNYVTYKNYKASVDFITHPIKSLFSYFHKQAQINKQNKEIEQQNRLLGNSVFKDFKIGV